MVFKEMVAYLLNGDGTYSCSNDISAEKDLYLEFEDGVQSGVDTARRLNPDWTEVQLHDYVSKGDSISQTMLKAKECLEQHGYDTSTLPQVVVPEFGDVASLVLRIGIGASIIAGTYAAKYFNAKKGYSL
jgi:hypothetical protein